MKNNVSSSSEPVTPAEYFLRDLFMDEDFVAIRKEFNKELRQVDLGLSQLIGRSTSPRSEKILVSLVEKHVFVAGQDLAKADTPNGQIGKQQMMIHYI